MPTTATKSARFKGKVSRVFPVHVWSRICQQQPLNLQDLKGRCLANISVQTHLPEGSVASAWDSAALSLLESQVGLHDINLLRKEVDGENSYRKPPKTNKNIQKDVYDM